MSKKHRSSANRISNDARDIEHLDGYHLLANAIVRQAVSDYRSSLRLVHRYPEDKDFRMSMEYQEKFFRGQRFMNFTGVEGHYLIELLKGEADVDSNTTNKAGRKRYLKMEADYLKRKAAEEKLKKEKKMKQNAFDEMFGEAEDLSEDDIADLISMAKENG